MITKAHISISDQTLPFDGPLPVIKRLGMIILDTDKPPYKIDWSKAVSISPICAIESCDKRVVWFVGAIHCPDHHMTTYRCEECGEIVETISTTEYIRRCKLGNPVGVDIRLEFHRQCWNVRYNGAIKALTLKMEKRNNEKAT